MVSRSNRELPLAACGNERAPALGYRTSQPKVVVAGGDTRRGQSLVGWASTGEREAARQVAIVLTGKTALPSQEALPVRTGTPETV